MATRIYSIGGLDVPEPPNYNHTGTPALTERAYVNEHVRTRLDALIDDLIQEGWTSRKAASLVATTAIELRDEIGGERWTAHRQAYATVLNVLSGGHAKGWSASAILEAVLIIEEAT
jgi:hypothetical protein